MKAAFSPDGSHILSGSTDRKAYIWQASPLAVRMTLQGGAHMCTLGVRPACIQQGYPGWVRLCAGYTSG